MNPFKFLLLFSSLLSLAISQSILQILPENLNSGHIALSSDRNFRSDEDLFCESWKFSVEANDAGIWTQIPERCIGYVQDYVTGDRYASDSDFVAGYSYEFGRSVNISGDGKDAWIFDIDETLLSNLPYYAAHEFGWEEFNETSYDEWVNLARAPALPASLKLYKELQSLGFQLILLTGRTESQRNVTQQNLLFAGYSSWERLILRGGDDVGKIAVIYKSEKRKELEEEGFRIHGSSGDQWSDLLGSPMAKRSFKLPNPMYYIE
ncbi:HAD superfamily, subfamily IIIB acid phosphatase [Tasmannia lanceolata]|uniref:HAD superfamily, subfamily IIIB acid phosphatase n=1 Tax=Tasmannia lanceolata TaxID=3420 RepID=UPI004063AE26